MLIFLSPVINISKDCMIDVQQKQFKCCLECHETKPDSLPAASFISSSGKIFLCFETHGCFLKCQTRVLNEPG